MRKEKLFQAFLSLALILPELAAAQDLVAVAFLTLLEKIVVGVLILLVIFVPIYLVSVYSVVKRKPKTEEETGQENAAASALNEAGGQRKGGVDSDLSRVDSLSNTAKNGEPQYLRTSGCLKAIFLTALFAFLLFIGFIFVMQFILGSLFW